MNIEMLRVRLPTEFSIQIDMRDICNIGSDELKNQMDEYGKLKQHAIMLGYTVREWKDIETQIYHAQFKRESTI